MTFGVALEVLRKQSNCWDKITECSAKCEECECHVDASDLVEAVRTVLDTFGNCSELPNGSGDLISRQDALSLLNEVPYLKEHPNTAIVWEEWIKSLPSVQAQQMIPTQMSGTSNYSPKFKPGDKFLLEIGEKRIGLDEYSIVGTDLYVWGSLLEKLTPYEPTVQAEQKKGHWIPVDDPSITGRCSVCGFESHLCEDDVYGYDYCPNCGARLEVVDE